MLLWQPESRLNLHNSFWSVLLWRWIKGLPWEWCWCDNLQSHLQRCQQLFSGVNLSLFCSQVQGHPGRPFLYRNATHCFKTIFQQEGFRAFYRGMLSSYMKVKLSTFQTLSHYLPVGWSAYSVYWQFLKVGHWQHDDVVQKTSLQRYFVLSYFDHLSCSSLMEWGQNESGIALPILMLFSLVRQLLSLAAWPVIIFCALKQYANL